LLNDSCESSIGNNNVGNIDDSFQILESNPFQGNVLGKVQGMIYQSIQNKRRSIHQCIDEMEERFRRYREDYHFHLRAMEDRHSRKLDNLALSFSNQLDYSLYEVAHQLSEIIPK